jgi:hypothetical protein
MHSIKKRKISLIDYQIIMNKENEDISIFDSIDDKSFEYQLSFYKNKLVFLELPEIRTEYGKDFIQQEIKDTTEKFRNLLRQK